MHGSNRSTTEIGTMQHTRGTALVLGDVPSRSKTGKVSRNEVISVSESFVGLSYRQGPWSERGGS